MSKKTSIKELELPRVYVNAILRYGFEYVEDIEEHFKDSDALPLSKIMSGFGPKGDYLVEDAIAYYRHGKHIEKPVNILEQEQNIRIQNAVKQMDLEKKRKLADFAENLLK